MNDNQQWAENIIIIDAEYADSVTFDLTVNFERMLERRIPKADLPLWLDCVALDGGIRQGDNNIQVVFVHEKTNDKLTNFQPASYADDISGKAFKDNIGEFSLMAIATEDIAPKEQMFTDIMQTVLSLSNVKRVIAVPDENNIDSLRMLLRQQTDDKNVTMLTMQPIAGGNFKQEILGYSLMQALGIHADEIETKH